jgi:threonine dehydrogenase-like Zn-dependent dehydrogenase
MRRLWQPCLWSSLGGLTLRELPEPELPGDDWVGLRTLLGGVCGTDLAILGQKQAPDSILQAFSSMPMGLGHENVAVVDRLGSAVDKSWLGRRVCVEPTLACRARGIDTPCGPCSRGEFGACENFGASGVGSYGLPAGTSIGYNSRTGGSWGEHFVAHVSQLCPAPEGLSDELALLTDPLACSLHAVLRSRWREARRVLVYGAGVMGLGVVASLRAMGFEGAVDALDPAAQGRRLAAKFGATAAFALPPGPPARRGAIIAERTGAALHRVRLGNYMLTGGYDLVFDCAGSRRSIGECLKWTMARGQVVLVATSAGAGADLTPIWFRELDVVGAYGRQDEHVQGRRISTYALVHELMAAGKLPVEEMLTHKFALQQYKRAMETAMNKSRHQAVKVALDFRNKPDGAHA